MSIRSPRLCHHCTVPLSRDECLHYVFECHACAMAGHDLETAVRRNPSHPEAARLANGPVDIAPSAPRRRKPVRLRIISGSRAA